MSVTWVQHTNRATNAPYTIYDGTPQVGLVTANQRNAPVADHMEGGRPFQTLGTFIINSGTLTIELSDAANGYVVADAVRIELVGEAGPDITPPEADLADPLNGSTIDEQLLNNRGYLDVTFTDVGAGIDASTLNGDELSLSGSGVGSAVIDATAPTLVGGDTYRYTFSGSFTQGTVNVDFVASSFADLAGNANNSETESFVVSTAPVVQIMDDGDTGFTTVGSWSHWTSDGYQSDLEFSASGSGSDVASWTTTGLAAGEYEVSVTWVQHTNRATNAPYTIYDGTTEVGLVTANQRNAPVADHMEGGRPFQTLGTFIINSGTLTIELSDAANGYVIADAVRIERVEEAGPTLSLSLADPAILENGGFTTATVTRSGDTTDALTVSLTSSDSSEVVLPSQVIIAAGASFATFQIDAFNDSDADFNSTIFVTASASGFIDGVTSIDVYDVETFQIIVEFTDSNMSASQQASFVDAAARWSEVILGNLPAIVHQGDLIDDLLISASAPAIDGVGGVLGQAGPTWIRNGSDLPLRGIMEFDIADLDNLESSGQLEIVIIHEMGHVLGIGTLWETFELILGAGTSNPRFIGSGAVAEYNAIFGTSGTSVPVENTGGTGTRDGHWRETVFGNELMTGYLNSGANPLSRITIASLGDMGYTVDLAAADFYVPPGSLVAGGSGDDGGDSLAVVLYDDADQSHDDHEHVRYEFQIYEPHNDEVSPPDLHGFNQPSPRPDREFSRPVAGVLDEAFAQYEDRAADAVEQMVATLVDIRSEWNRSVARGDSLDELHRHVFAEDQQWFISARFETVYSRVQRG